jgi:hypothetical protein
MSRIVEWLYRKFNRIQLHCYFHNFKSFILLHTMNPLWGMSCPKVQFTSNSSQTVPVDIISAYTMRVTVACRIYIYSKLPEPRSLFPWQNIGLTVRRNKSSFHIQCCLMRALQGISRHRFLFPVLYMIF